MNGLCSHAVNDDSRMVSNSELFRDLLDFINLFPCCDESFHRPIEVQPSQAQFSELHLAEQWRMGRKKIHNLLSSTHGLKLIRVDGMKISAYCRARVLGLTLRNRLTQHQEELLEKLAGHQSDICLERHVTRE